MWLQACSGTFADSYRKSKKSKGAKSVVPMTAGVFPYHPEEEFIDKVSYDLRRRVASS